MKKTNYFVLFLISFSSYAQVLVNENFNNLPLGNVGTNITGTSPSNGFITTANNGAVPTTGNNADNSNFQIVANNSIQQNVFQLIGTNGDKGSRNLWFDAFPSLWSNRISSNTIIEVEFDLFTGTAGGVSENTKGFYVLDPTFTKILSGFIFNTKTLVLTGVSYLEPGAPLPSANYNFFLGNEQNLVLPANTWVRLGFSYNKSNGLVRWKGPNFNKQDVGSVGSSNLEPSRLIIASRSGSVAASGSNPAITNTAAGIGLFDNIIAKATNTDNLLSITNIQPNLNSSIVYPNPVKNELFINSDKMLDSFEVYNQLGQKMQVKQNNLTLDFTSLSSGIYYLILRIDGKLEHHKIIKE